MQFEVDKQETNHYGLYGNDEMIVLPSFQSKKGEGLTSFENPKVSNRKHGFDVIDNFLEQCDTSSIGSSYWLCAQQTYEYLCSMFIEPLSTILWTSKDEGVFSGIKSR
jgi:hypothetical protein